MENQEIEMYKQQAEHYKRQAEANQQQLNELRKERALVRAVSADADIIDAGTVAQLLADRVRFNPDSGALEGVNEAISALKLSSPYLTWSGNPEYRESAGRKAPAGIEAVTDADRAKQIFGRGSDSALANRLAKQNITEYRRLRAVAHEQALI